MLLVRNSYLKKAISSKKLIAALIGIICLVTIQPAFAHHPFGGDTPANFFQGFFSGLGHPIIGLDHFAFVVAVGLLAVLPAKKGFLIPLAFTLATALGTILHLQSIDLPFLEIIIALSVLTVGTALGLQKNFNVILLVVLSSIAGIFHGFAYGEAIFGAEMTPLGAYLLGFVGIQLTVSAIAFALGRLTVSGVKNQTSLPLRFAGFAIAGIGFTFFSNAILG